MARAQTLAEEMGLGAFAHSRRTQQNQSPAGLNFFGRHRTVSQRSLKPCSPIILILYIHWGTLRRVGDDLKCEPGFSKASERHRCFSASRPAASVRNSLAYLLPPIAATSPSGSELMKLHILGFGLLQDGNVGVFPEREDPDRRSGFGGVALQGVGACEAEAGKRADTMNYYKQGPVGGILPRR